MRAAALLTVVLLSAPAVAEDLSGGAAEIAAAERAFAKKCGEVGVRASFLEYFAPRAVSFAPGPGDARERLEKRPVLNGPPPVLAEWGPEQVELAPAGDLGWSTGPSRFTDKSGKNPTYHGNYFSLWRKQPDGTWKVELDIGVEATDVPIPTEAVAVGGSVKKPTQGGVEAVRRADDAFCKRAARGAAKAYAAALAPNGRVHRDKMTPAVGAAARAWAARLEGPMTCKADAAVSSSGPGFGYTYGSWSAGAAKGFYTRVWRLDAGGWRIAVDVAQPAE